MSDFPWNGKVLFNREFYAANSLPLYYIPLLLTIQLTEPIVVLFSSGVLFAGWDLINKKHTWRQWAIIFLWFFVVFLLLLLFILLIMIISAMYYFSYPPSFCSLV